MRLFGRAFRRRTDGLVSGLDTGQKRGSGFQYRRLTTLANWPVGNDASMAELFYQQEKTADRASIVSLAGEKVWRTRCAIGDTDVAGSGQGERCELMIGSGQSYWNDGTMRFVPGDEMLLGTMFYIDSSFSSPGFLYGTDNQAFCNFVQTHHGSGTGQVPFQLNLCTDDARLGMRIIGGGNALGPYNVGGAPVGSTTEWWWTLAGPANRYSDTAQAPTQDGAGGFDASVYLVPKGQWLSLLMNVKYNTSGAGYAKVWVNGIQRFNVTGVSIGYNNEPGAYLKWGFYRSTAASHGTPVDTDAIIYWRDWIEFPTVTDGLRYYGHA